MKLGRLNFKYREERNIIWGSINPAESRSLVHERIDMKLKVMRGDELEYELSKRSTYY